MGGGPRTTEGRRMLRSAAAGGAAPRPSTPELLLSGFPTQTRIQGPAALAPGLGVGTLCTPPIHPEGPCSPGTPPPRLPCRIQGSARSHVGPQVHPKPSAQDTGCGACGTGWRAWAGGARGAKGCCSPCRPQGKFRGPRASGPRQSKARRHLSHGGSGGSQEFQAGHPSLQPHPSPAHLPVLRGAQWRAEGRSSPSGSAGGRERATHRVGGTRCHHRDEGEPGTGAGGSQGGEPGTGGQGVPGRGAGYRGQGVPGRGAGHRGQGVPDRRGQRGRQTTEAPDSRDEQRVGEGRWGHGAPGDGMRRALMG